MGEGEARILTLKDSRILDNQGKCRTSPYSQCPLTYYAEDELQNVEMAEDERIKKNNELKIKNRAYTGYDDDEFVPGTEGMKRAVLAKYSEEIDGKKDMVSLVKM
jgi:U4/U6.U5 tri-snRNP-associated protein 1